MTSSGTFGNIDLQSDVTRALRRSGSVVSLPGVSAHEGVVTLSGSVDTSVERAAARTVAGRVRGVAAVINDLVVRRQRIRSSDHPATP